MSVPAIDAWAQPAPAGAFTSSMFAPLIERARASERVAMAVSAERIVAAMDDAGIARVMLCAWRLPDHWMISNDQIAEFVDRFPDRLVGVASLSLDDENAVAELENLVVNRGFKALRILPWLWNRP